MDALKVNGIKTIHRVAGIPIIDFVRIAQVSEIRYINFRQQTSAGYTAAAAGFLAQHPCVSNGVGTRLSQRPSCLGKRHDEVLSDDSDLGVQAIKRWRICSKKITMSSTNSTLQSFSRTRHPRLTKFKTLRAAWRAPFTLQSRDSRAPSTAISSVMCWSEPWRPRPHPTQFTIRRFRAPPTDGSGGCLSRTEHVGNRDNCINYNRLIQKQTT